MKSGSKIKRSYALKIQESKRHKFYEKEEKKKNGTNELTPYDMKATAIYLICHIMFIFKPALFSACNIAFEEGKQDTLFFIQLPTY